MIETPAPALRYRLKSYYLDKLRQLSSDHAARPAAVVQEFEKVWDTLKGIHREILLGRESDPTLRRFCIGYARHGWHLLRLLRPAQESIDWLQPAIDSTQELGKQRLQARLLGYLGEAHLNLGDHRQATTNCRAGLELLDGLGDSGTENRAKLLHQFGRSRRNAGKDAATQEAAQQAFEQAIAIARQLQKSDLAGRILIDLGNIRANRGFYAEGLERYDEAKQAMAQGDLNDKLDEARRQGFIGNARRNLGHYEPAIEAYEKAIKLFQQLNDLQQVGTQQFNLGLVYRDQGRFEAQARALNRALEIARSHEDSRGHGKALNSLGTSYAYSGNYDLAIECHQKGLAMLSQDGAWFIVAFVRADLALTHLLYGDTPEALEAARAALEFSIGGPHKLHLLQRHTLVARCHLLRHQLPQAQRHLKLAREFEGSESTAASRHAAAALRGLVELRLMALEKGQQQRDNYRDGAEQAFRAALSYCDQVLDYTAPYYRGLAHCGLALSTASSVEHTDLASRSYGHALQSCSVPKVVEEHLALLDQLLTLRASPTFQGEHLQDLESPKAKLVQALADGEQDTGRYDLSRTRSTG